MEDLKLFEGRKRDHIRLALNKKTQNIVSTQFDRIGLLPEALPEHNFSETNLSTQLLNHKFNSPHFISSMTAGHKQGLAINQMLAQAAAEKKWLFCIGSQKKELLNAKDEVLQNKKLLKSSPSTKFVSNIGIEEVIHYKVEQVVALAESLNSIGIIVHVNALQEIFQNKGDVKFKNSLNAIESLVKKSHLPIIVKEVGFGISSKTAEKLFNIGVSVVDVAGHGGTHWGMIEALRQSPKALQSSAIKAFSDWGLSTVESLLMNQALVGKKNIWASGGIRSGVDSAKCLALGAKAVGIAQPLLKAAISNSGKLNNIKFILAAMDQFDFELKTAMYCSGLQTVSQFSQRKVWYEKR